LWNTEHAPDRVIPAIKNTLANLKLDYLDLYLIHWPMGFKSGAGLFPKDASGGIAYSDVHYLQTWAKMEECVNLGLTKSIGLSNFNSKQVDEVLANAKIRPVTNQVSEIKLKKIPS
jgi:diketogulonate reductase-like aldo/keto reductase